MKGKVENSVRDHLAFRIQFFFKNALLGPTDLQFCLITLSKLLKLMEKKGYHFNTIFNSWFSFKAMVVSLLPVIRLRAVTFFS